MVTNNELGNDYATTQPMVTNNELGDYNEPQTMVTNNAATLSPSSLQTPNFGGGRKKSRRKNKNKKQSRRHKKSKSSRKHKK